MARGMSEGGMTVVDHGGGTGVEADPVPEISLSYSNIIHQLVHEIITAAAPQSDNIRRSVVPQTGDSPTPVLQAGPSLPSVGPSERPRYLPSLAGGRSRESDESADCLHRAAPVGSFGGTLQTAIDKVPQGLAFHQFGDNVGDAVTRPEVVDGDDVGVIEGAGRASLLLESGTPGAILGRACGQHLRPTSRPSRVSRAIHLTHTPRPERREDIVRPQFRPGGQSHCYDDPFSISDN
jgi:hypothetical protein